MKKILIVGSANSVFIYEYIKNVLLKDGAVVVIANVQYEDYKIPDEFLKFYRENRIEIKQFGLKNSKRFHRMLAAASILPKSCQLTAIAKRFDLIHIHGMNWSGIFMPHFLKKQRLVTTIYGSDLLRTSSFLHLLWKKLLSKSIYITLETDYLISFFTKVYKGKYQNKIRKIGFGSDHVEMLYHYMVDKATDKQSLDIPQDKISIFVGYNGSKGQQHIEAIKRLSMLPNIYKDKIYLFLHCSYGLNKEYESALQETLDQSGIAYQINKQYLRGERLISLRNAADIFLNMQITDVLSSSLLEFMMTRTIIIQGTWLEYRELEAASIIKINDFSELSDFVIYCVDHRKELFDQVCKNVSIAYELMSWKKKINEWESILEINL